MNKVIAQIQEAMSDYGPPYEYDEYFEGALLFETSQPNCKASSVHSLLNCKVDPNDVDKEDLNFTPMHYCARYCHLAAMRMLIKAKAYVNVLNEFGQTPLTVCVLVKQSINNERNQFVMAEYLLDNGAYVDVRDKVRALAHLHPYVSNALVLSSSFRPVRDVAVGLRGGQQ